ncbi:hypothetical protein E8A73_044085 [Polyangium aurulentum]|nr:hypothetical protein E8A73_044085 [Polyangium aurulentum]
MGQPDLFAKRTFAEETERVTSGAVTWQDPPEMRLEKVQSDGLLLVRRPGPLSRLAPPWPEAQPHGEIMVELKMPGDHLDRQAIERALLRRQARQVQRLEEEDASWMGDEPLWVVAPHLPEWIAQIRTPVRFAPGCYRIEPSGFSLLWIAANELPLADELVPFLVARSGRALDAFGLWVATRRPLDWVAAMLEFLSMSMPIREQIERRFPPTDDPEVQERRDWVLRWLLKGDSEPKQELIEQGVEKGLIVGARAALRRVLARRQLSLSPADEARIDTCEDPSTLERWLDQAITATSAAEALQ